MSETSPPSSSSALVAEATRLFGEWLWKEARAFARAAGHCERSDEWHNKEVCLTCQELVNFARHVLRGTELERDALSLRLSAASLFVRRIIEAIGRPEPPLDAIVDLQEIALQVIGQIEEGKTAEVKLQGAEQRIVEQLPPLNCQIHGPDAEGRCCTGCVADHAKQLTARAEAAAAALREAHEKVAAVQRAAFDAGNSYGIHYSGWSTDEAYHDYLSRQLPQETP